MKISCACACVCVPGLNDGSVNGVSYFTCPPACGVFAKPDMFDLIGEKESAGGHADDG